MNAIWFTCILIGGFLLAFVSIETEKIVDAVSISASFILFFMLFFAAIKIYEYHIYKLTKLKRFPNVLRNFFVENFAIFLSATITTIVWYRDFTIAVTIYSVVLYFVVIYLCFDKKGGIGQSIIDFYETNLDSRKQDLFLKYPPNDVSDLVIPVLIGLVLFIIGIMLIFI